MRRPICRRVLASIRSQGEPWEDLLEASGDHGLRSPANFPTFDFFDPASRIATSAKTLDTRAPTYVDRPSRIYGRLRDYFDRIEKFEHSEQEAFRILPGQTTGAGSSLPCRSTPRRSK